MEKLEKKIDDPWELLGKELQSKHCNGKKAKIVVYDHTGAIKAKCECGIIYWYDHGAYKIQKLQN